MKLLCPKQACPHYWVRTQYPRQCYYEPQCWRGVLAECLSTINLLWKYRKGANGK